MKKNKKNRSNIYLLVLFVGMLISVIVYRNYYVGLLYNNSNQRYSIAMMDLKSDYCDIECFLEDKKNTISFLSKTFGINENDLVLDLIEVNKNSQYNEFNIGRKTNKKGDLISYKSFDRGLVEYLYDYCKKNPGKVNNEYVPYKGNSKYVEELIAYFTDVYDEVDYLTAISIGAAESGSYKVKYMLSYNNVFGGMSSSGLIKYKNIEYGVLSYIRLLANGYYNQGLNTVETIGKKYCPTTDENGKSIASPHWISLVKAMKNKYANSNDSVTVDKLMEYSTKA